MAHLTLRDVERTPLERALPVLVSLASPLTGIAALKALPPPVAPPALADAIGRELKRYAGAYIDEDRIRIGYAAELGARAARPETFALYHPRQYAEHVFPYVAFSPTTRIRWTPAFRLPHGEPALVPTQLVGMGTAFHGEPRLDDVTQAGLGCALTLEEAILTGLLELIAHDAFMLTWRAQLSLPLVVDEKPATRIGHAAIDLSQIHAVPTALGIVRGNQGGLNTFCVSAATIGQAVDAALRGALADNRRHLRSGRDSSRDLEQAPFIDRSPRRVSMSHTAPIGGTSVTGQIFAVVAGLARRGVDVYVVETTPPDLVAAGLRTAAVVAPQLCRFDIPGRPCHLGGERLYRAAFECGLAESHLTIERLSRLPVPCVLR